MAKGVWYLMALTTIMVFGGCKQEAPPVAPQWIQGPRAVHLRFEFYQSPLEGFPKQSSLRETAEPQFLDINVALNPERPDAAHVDGYYEVYHTLRDEAKMLLVGKCEYDLNSGDITVHPLITRMRPPDAVIPKLAYLGGSPLPPFTTGLPLRSPLILSPSEQPGGPDEALWTGPGNQTRYIRPLEAGAGEDAMIWGIGLRIVSHGALPVFTPMQKTRDGHEILASNYGFNRLMLE